eukprot:366432-Chlamydomonas_euryale.AAC.16
MTGAQRPGDDAQTLPPPPLPPCMERTASGKRCKTALRRGSPRSARRARAQTRAGAAEGVRGVSAMLAGGCCCACRGAVAEARSPAAPFGHGHPPSLDLLDQRRRSRSGSRELHAVAAEVLRCRGPFAHVNPPRPRSPAVLAAIPPIPPL